MIGYIEFPKEKLEENKLYYCEKDHTFYEHFLYIENNKIHIIIQYNKESIWHNYPMENRFPPSRMVTIIDPTILLTHPAIALRNKAKELLEKDLNT